MPPSLWQQGIRRHYLSLTFSSTCDWTEPTLTYRTLSDSTVGGPTQKPTSHLPLYDQIMGIEDLVEGKRYNVTFRPGKQDISYENCLYKGFAAIPVPGEDPPTTPPVVRLLFHCEGQPIPFLFPPDNFVHAEPID